MLTFDEARKTTVITCEHCPQTFSRAEAPFDIPSTVQTAKMGKWSIRREAGGWRHFCPTHANIRFKGKLL